MASVYSLSFQSLNISCLYLQAPDRWLAEEKTEVTEEIFDFCFDSPLVAFLPQQHLVGHKWEDGL